MNTIYKEKTADPRYHRRTFFNKSKSLFYIYIGSSVFQHSDTNQNQNQKPSFFRQLIRWGLGSIGTPTAQVHDFPKRLLRSLCPRSASNHRRRRRRELVIGLREWLDEVVLGVVVNRPHGVVPPAEALVLQRLHCSDARRNDPSFACRTHDDVNFLKNLWVIVCSDADDMEVFV